MQNISWFGTLIHKKHVNYMFYNFDNNKLKTINGNMTT